MSRLERLVRTRWVVALALVVATALQVDAAIVLSLGGSPLANNSVNQQLQLFIASDSGTVTGVQGANLAAFIGTGAPSQPGTPIFQSFNWAPAFLANFDFPFVQPGQTPELGNNFRSFEGVQDLITGGNSFSVTSTPVLLGTYILNTTGIFDSTFAFGVGDTPGSNSALTFTSGPDLPITFAGTFDVGSPVAVPEPGSMALLAVGGVVAASRYVGRRRRRAESQPAQAV